MKKQEMSTLQKVFLLIGSCLITVSAILLISSVYGANASQKVMVSYVDKIKTAIPEPQGAVIEKQPDTLMPALSIDGIDFIGILEMPSQGSELPVCGQWKRPSKYPCRLSGSIYDGSIQIGGSAQKGQYDFYREISVGDQVYFTDMLGNRYGYTVTDIQYEKHADQSALRQEDAALTLFIKNMYAFEYIIVFCDN